MEYSQNSYFSTIKKQSQQPQEEVNSSTLQPVKIDPKIVYDKFVRTSETGDKVYFVENGNAHWIKNPETLAALGGDFGKVVTIAYDVLRTLNLRVIPIDMKNVAEYAPKPEAKTAVVQERVNENEVEKIEETIKQTENPPKPLEREKGVLSYIVLINGAEITIDNLNALKQSIIDFKELIKVIPHEIVLVANGTTMSPQAIEFNFADKIVVLNQPLDFHEALFKGVRVAKGEYPLLLC